jgi:hypothetical protein
VGLERPRHRNDPRFLALRAEILEMLHFDVGGGDDVAERGGDPVAPDALRSPDPEVFSGSDRG